jgi:hypothetical protein
MERSIGLVNGIGTEGKKRKKERKKKKKKKDK